MLVLTYKGGKVSIYLCKQTCMNMYVCMHLGKFINIYMYVHIYACVYLCKQDICIYACRKTSSQHSNFSLLKYLLQEKIIY